MPEFIPLIRHHGHSLFLLYADMNAFNAVYGTTLVRVTRAPGQRLARTTACPTVSPARYRELTPGAQGAQ